MLYQNRLLLYVDILGWSNAIRPGNEDPRLLKAVEAIHSHAEVHNESFRQQCIARAGEIVEIEPGRKGTWRVNPIFLEVQFGAFSDHFVYSIPERLGPRIVTTASNLVVHLLQAGWLTRGAIVLGSLYHKDNMIFGPALLEAVHTEENQAIYPRILLSDAVLKSFDDWDLDDGYKSHIKDQFGRVVVNPFALPFDVSDPDQKIAAVKSFAELNFGFKEIKPMLDEQVDAHTKADRGPQAEKWAYLRNFITGPVFREIPELKHAW